MAYIFTENVESGSIQAGRGGLTAIRIFYVKSDLPADENVLLNTEAVALDPGIIPLGTPHPELSNIILKDWRLNPSEALNHGKLTYTYSRADGGGNGGQSTPDANGEIWTFNMVSQQDNINMVKSDANGNPQQLTFSGVAPKGAQIHNAINFTDEGDLIGADVYRPTETVNVTKTYSVSEIDQAYRNTIRSLQNKLNDAQWPNRSEFLAGELLFLGADISYNLEEDTATVNYSFQAGETKIDEKYTIWKKDATIDDKTTEITIPRIYPFQYVWASLDTRRMGGSTIDVTQKSRLIPNVLAVHVADVYEYGDFSQLKLSGD